MKRIEQLLKQWRDDRNIITLSNTLKDDLLSEVEEAKKEEEMRNLILYIEEVCDVAIIALNAIGLMNMAYNQQNTRQTEYKLNDLINTIESINLDINHQAYLLLCTVVTICETLVEAKRFNFSKSIEEKIKLINSRKQCPKQKEKWNKFGAVGKWLKFEKQDQATLYVPNFKSCIKELNK